MTRERARGTVLFVARVGHFGGSVVSLRVLLEHLDPAIGRVVAVTGGTPAEKAYRASEAVDDVVPIRWRGWRAIPAAARLAGWALRNRRDLLAVHANGSADLLLALPAALVSGRPLVAWIHDQRLKRRAVQAAPLLRACRGRIRWVANSRHTARTLVEHGLARPGDVEVAHPPVDPARVVAERRPAEGGPRIAYAGGDTRRKGFHLLPAVLDGLAGTSARLLVFTNRHAERPEAIRRTWERLDSDPRVEVAGRRDDVREVYARADVVFVPALQESFGRLVAEAMVNGIPVVASDLPAVRELVGDDEAGLLFEPGDAAAAVEAIRRMIGDPERRERAGAAGRERARAFRPEATVPVLERAYLGG